MARAYAPYSGFRVGAAVEADDGSVYAGCNVENSSYPVTLCAERAAIGAAVAAVGELRLHRVFVCSTALEPTPPCGMCRQALAEFGPDVEIVSEGSRGDTAVWRLSELLPRQFRLGEPPARGRGEPE
jgi:cytidine deaminase